MKVKNIELFIFALFFLYLFFTYNVNFHGPDEPIYFAYTSSIVEDHDLNPVNRVYYEFGSPVSETYNLPDWHSYAGVVLWSPFYLYAKSIYSLAANFNLTSLSNYGFNKIAQCAMSFSTVLFAFFTIFLTYTFCKLFFSGRKSLLSTIAIFFGTPFFYYILVEPGNANIIGSLFAVILIWFSFYITDFKEKSWFLYGLFFSICIAVRAELWLLGLPMFLLSLALSVPKKERWKKILYFSLGFLFIFTLRSVNAYLKYGTLHLEEIFYLSSLLRYKTTFSFSGLFSSFRGILYTSPILYLCLIGFLAVVLDLFSRIKYKNLRENKKEIFIFILSLYFLFKLLFIGRIYSPGGDTLSTRLLLSEFPIMVLLCARAITQVRKIFFKHLFTIASLLFIFWNFLIISEFMAGFDWVYVANIPPFLLRIISIRYIFDFLFYINNLGIKSIILLPLLVLGLVLFLKRKVLLKYAFYLASKLKLKRGDNMFFNSLSVFTAYCSIFYLIATSLNLANNRINVESLKKEGFFDNAKVIKSSPLELTRWEEEEYLWSLFKMVGYYALNEDNKKADEVKRAQEDIFGRQPRMRQHFLPIKPYHTLASMYNASGRYNKAKKYYEDVIRLDNNDLDAYISLGDICKATGDYHKAIACYKKVLEVNPDLPGIYIRLADIYGDIGEQENRMKYLKKALDFFPQSHTLYQSLANTYHKQNEYEKAIDYYNKALKLNPYAYSTYTDMGHLYYSQVNYSEAIKYYQKAVELNPQYIPAYTNLAQLYRDSGNYDKSIYYYKKLVRLIPGPKTYLQIADLYSRQGNQANQIEYLEKALKITPESSDILTNLAQIYKKRGNYDKTIDYYKRLIKIMPNAIHAYRDIGHIFNGMGNHQEAVYYFEKAISLDPSDPEMQKVLGIVYYTLDDTEGMSRQIKNLKELNRSDLAMELEKLISNSE